MKIIYLHLTLIKNILKVWKNLNFSDVEVDSLTLILFTGKKNH